MKTKIYKALSILLTLLIIFSTCSSILGTVSAADATYYVRCDGNDADTGKKNKPKLSLAGVVNAAIAKGCKAGDTVTVKVIPKIEEGKERKDQLPWGEDIPEHAFKLVVTSLDNKEMAIIGGNEKSISLGGDTSFENITVAVAKNYSLAFNEHNVSFAKDVTINATDASFVLGAVTGDATIDRDVNVNFDTSVTNLKLSGVNGSRIYNGKINVSINKASANPVLHFSGSNGTTTYNNLVNIDLKKAYSLSLALGKENPVFGVNGAIQIINSSNFFKITDSKEILTNIAKENTYVLHNKTGIDDLIKFTDTKGKFAVDTSRFKVKAVPRKGGEAIEVKNGFLEVPAGEYDIIPEKDKREFTVYVEEGADGTNDTYPTIAEAVEAASKAGYICGDEVTVKLKGETVTMGALPMYTFDLFVTSDNETERTTISFPDAGLTLANNEGATTKYDNVIFHNKVLVYNEKTKKEEWAKGEWKNLLLNSCNVVLGKKVTFDVGYGTSFYFGTNNDSKTLKGQKFEINSNIPYGISLSNLSYAGKRTYTEDVELLVNNSGAKPHIFFNASSVGKSNGTTVFKKNVNLNFRQASGVGSFNYGSGVTIEGALQILNSTTTTVNIKDKEIEAITADKKIILNNKSGEVDLLKFTETPGKFKVNPSNPLHRDLVFALAADGEKIFAKDGYLTLGTGQYELRIDRDPVVKEYYIDEKGITVDKDERPATAGTKKNPVKSFTDVTRLIAQDNLADIDIAKVYIMGDQVDWYLDDDRNNSPTNHVCTVIFDSASEGNRPKIYAYNSIVLTGNMEFRSVELQVGYQWGSFRIGHNNVIFGEDCYINVPTTNLGFSSSPSTIDHNIDIVIKGKFSSNVLQLGSEYNDGIYNGDINITYDNAETNASIQIGGMCIEDAQDDYTYNGNINIKILKAKAFGFSKKDKSTVVMNGALHVLVDDSVKLPYSTLTKFNELEVAGGKWYVTNAATDDDFVSFTENKGEFAIKNKAKAYIRQALAESETVETSGTLKLADGAYTVSDKSIPFIADESHKMLYFLTSGGGHHLASRARVTPGETYIFEFSVYSNLYEDLTPCVRDDGDRGVTATPEIISETKIGDYYRIVCKATIPETYDKGSTAFFGVNLYSYSEGVIFDRTVYNINDKNKKDCFEINQNFHDGLDGVALDMVFWGKTFQGERGGTGVVSWERDYQKLEIVNFSEAYIKELIRLSNPDDGKWWKDSDIVEEELIVTYSGAKGSFKDHEGKPISGKKMALISEDYTYTDVTDAKGEFVFGKKVKGYKNPKIVSGFYELYILNGSEKIFTGYTSFIAEDEVVTFNVVSDLSSYMDGGLDSSMDYEELDPGDEVEEIVPSGNLYGTVYTPYAEVVPGVRIYLEGIDGQVSSNQNGEFGFRNLPVGTYRLYTVLADGSEYEFREIEIIENSDTTVKLKYDPPKVSTGNDGFAFGWIIWVIIASVVALAVVAVLIFFLVIKKKKA